MLAGMVDYHLNLGRHFAYPHMMVDGAWCPPVSPAPSLARRLSLLEVAIPQLCAPGAFCSSRVQSGCAGAALRRPLAVRRPAVDARLLPSLQARTC